MALTQSWYDLLKGTEKMKKTVTITILLMAAAGYLSAQDTESVDSAVESSPAPLFDYDESSTTTPKEDSEFEQNNKVLEDEPIESLSGSTNLMGYEEASTASPAPGTDNTNDKVEVEPIAEQTRFEELKSHFTFGATVDMQVGKEMWDVFDMDDKKRLQHQSLSHGYRQAFDDFWLRAALRLIYRSEYVESRLALRFYPYWTMRRKGKFQDGQDLERYLDILEINEAYLKVFKEYKTGENRFTPHFKIGRDGLLTTGSQLFGNYLELPTAGYGAARSSDVVGPFKNRKVFANQIELGFNFNLDEVMSSKTSIMIGGNVNNQQWYSAPTPAISEEMDSKLTAGFTRGYQDLYFWKERVHIGGGFRVYTTKISKNEDRVFYDSLGLPDTQSVYFATDSRYVNGDWTVDFGLPDILPGFKVYFEFGYQRLGALSNTGITRPFTAGIMIPTGGLLDILAVEIENVADTFFSDKSMRDRIGNRGETNSFAWGLVTEKWLISDQMVGVVWGVYSASPYGDMRTSLRLTANLK